MPDDVPESGRGGEVWPAIPSSPNNPKVFLVGKRSDESWEAFEEKLVVALKARGFFSSPPEIRLRWPAEWTETVVSHFCPGADNALPSNRFQVRLAGGDFFRGRRTLKEAPWPGTLSNETEPPWAWTMCLTMERPSPVPPAPRERSLCTR